MIKIDKEITEVYFDKRIGHWISRGFTFQNEQTKFLFLQKLSLFGSLVKNVSVVSSWRLYKIKDDSTLEDLTGNGIESDAPYLKTDNTSATQRRNGLAAAHITQLEEYAKERPLLENEAKKFIDIEVQPLLEKKVITIKRSVEKLPILSTSQLVNTISQIHDLLIQIKEMYPRSYEILQEILLKAREAYARVKYPKLYLELKRLHEDKQYKIDKDDDIAGFGYRLAHEGLFYQFFVESSIPSYMWEYQSPFEEKFGKSLFFKEKAQV